MATLSNPIAEGDVVLRRTNTHTGGVLLRGLGSKRPPGAGQGRLSQQQARDVEREVAWCGTDNLGMTRPDASRQAALAVRSLAVGEAFQLDHYRFEVVAGGAE